MCNLYIFIYKKAVNHYIHLTLEWKHKRTILKEEKWNCEEDVHWDEDWNFGQAKQKACIQHHQASPWLESAREA